MKYEKGDEMKSRKIIIIVTVILLLAGMLAAVSGVAVMFIRTNQSEKKMDGEEDFIAHAKAYLEKAEYQKALVSYQKANELDEDNLEVLHALGELYDSLGYYEEKKETYGELVEKESDLTDNWIKLAKSCIQLGELEEAKDIIEERMTSDGSDEILELYAEMNVMEPQFNLKSGEYDSYQLLELSEKSSNARVHYTMDGSEPTADAPEFIDGVVISAPETRLKAKAISYLGYESEAVELSFVVNVPVQECLMDDYSGISNFIKNEYLDRDWDEPVYTYELAQIRSFYLVGSYYVDTETIEAMFYADGYTMYENREMQRGDYEIEIIQYMPFLKKLAICYQESIDLEKLDELVYLEELSLLNDGIVDIGPLENFSSLKKLSLGWNEIQDVSPLSELDELVSLGLWNNQINDVSSLSGLSNLSYFNVTENPLTETSMIKVK